MTAVGLMIPFGIFLVVVSGALVSARGKVGRSNFSKSSSMPMMALLDSSEGAKANAEAETDSAADDTADVGKTKGIIYMISVAKIEAFAEN